MPVIYVVFESMSVITAVRQKLQCLFLMDCAIFSECTAVDSILCQRQPVYYIYLSIVLTSITFEKIFPRYEAIFHAPSFVNQS